MIQRSGGEQCHIGEMQEFNGFSIEEMFLR